MMGYNVLLLLLSWLTPIWWFPKIGVPQIVQVMDDHFSTESYGDLGIPLFRKFPDLPQ